MSTLLDKIKASSKQIKESLLDEKKEFDFISTGCLPLNILFSGKLDGGIPIGKVSMVASPSSLGKCSRGNQKVIIKVDLETLEIPFEILFKAIGCDECVTSDKVFHLSDENISIETPWGWTKINALVKKPVQEWINVTCENISEPIQVSPSHLFFCEEGLTIAGESLGKHLITKNGSSRVMEISEGDEPEGLYDLSINNSSAPIGFEEAYYQANGTLHHNSFVGLKVAKNAQKDYNMDVFYIDTEFAFDPAFGRNIGVDAERFLPIQSNRIEDVQQIIASSIIDLSKEEKKKLILIIDSWGGLVTSKTVNDAVSGKDVTDMTIAKKKNALARLLTGLGITVFVVNQTYETMDQYNPLAIGGGKGIIFASSSIVMGTSKAKSKDGDEINGSIITAKNYKGRFAIENAKLKYMIRYEGGIHPYYGILDMALESGHVVKPTQGWYSRPNITDDKKWREKEIWENGKEFWSPIVNDPTFKLYVEKRFSFAHNNIFDDSKDLDKNTNTETFNQETGEIYENV